ncbi:FAD-dependent oxidoreductase [Achromobacter insuavis]
MAHDYDVIVAGAGMVGAAAAYGLANLGRRVLLLDGADTDYRAAKANFGLVWLQGKGTAIPPTSACRARRCRPGPNSPASCRTTAASRWTTNAAAGCTSA